MVRVEMVMRKAQNMGVETIGELTHDHRRHYYPYFLPCR